MNRTWIIIPPRRRRRRRRQQQQQQHAMAEQKQQQNQQQEYLVDRTAIDVQVVTDRMARKEGELRKTIHEIQTQATGMADRVQVGGDFDRLLEEPALKKFRTVLKEIASENVVLERELKSYMNALKAIGDRTSSAVATANDGHDEDGKLQPDDFQTMIEQTMNEERAKLVQSSVDITQEPMYVSMLTRLKEEASSGGCGSLGAGGVGNNNDDSDDELLIVSVNGGPPGSSENLKCPITGMLMEEPLRNTTCNHVYSRQGIDQLLKTSHRNRCRCPVPGCVNSQLTKSQLVEDDDLKIKIRRFKKRQSVEKRSRNKTTMLSVDDDDDYE